MATEEEAIVPGAPWYSKFFEYWKNRNRVGPGKVELPDCDFFLVAQRRTLRILKPSLKSGWYYENTNDRPESVNDNFFTRWSRRPHSSGNCRCSFRQSRRLSTAEEQIISAELNRIRTSLCEAEENERAIEELEQRVSLNLQKLQVPLAQAEDEKTKVGSDETDDDETTDDEIDEQTVKNRIVKDLERYINVLLEEILDDTVKYMIGAESGPIKSKEDKQAANEKQADAERYSSNDASSFNDISFSFHADSIRKGTRDLERERECKNQVLTSEGYVNRGFIGSTNDPDSLDFYLRRSVGTDVVALEHLDCIDNIDSGINSVETIEFQPDQEPSLEQSLLKIIDEKLGRTPLSGNAWEDPRVLLDAAGGGPGPPDHDRNHQRQARPTKRLAAAAAAAAAATDEKKLIPRSGERSSSAGPGLPRGVRAGRSEPGKEGIDISKGNLEGNERGERERAVDRKDLEEAVNEPTFAKLRLEFKPSADEPSLRTKKGPKGRFCAKQDEEPSAKEPFFERCAGGNACDAKREPTPIELEDYRRTSSPTCEEKSLNPRDFVAYRKNRKPLIVFLHGFGSSAEIFEHQLQYFSALGYPCIAPDMLGHGMSSAPGRPRDYHFGKLLKDLDAVLCHYAFKPDQKCVLVAHNYGCSFAAALACKYDSSIHQLVLISGGGPTPLAPPSTESAGHCCLRAVLAPFLMCGLHRDILYSAKGRQHPYCGPEPPEQWPSHMKYILDGMVWPEGDYIFHRRICTPTLLVHGLRDNKVSLVQECQMERTMVKAFLEAIPASGHTPMTDCPEQLNHMIHCFIDLWKNKKW